MGGARSSWLRQGSGAAATEARREQGGLRGREDRPPSIKRHPSLSKQHLWAAHSGPDDDEEAPHALTELSASRGGREL